MFGLEKKELHYSAKCHTFLMSMLAFGSVTVVV